MMHQDRGGEPRRGRGEDHDPGDPTRAIRQSHQGFRQPLVGEPMARAGGERKWISGRDGEVIEDPFAGTDLPVGVAIVEDGAQKHHERKHHAECDDARRVEVDREPACSGFPRRIALAARRRELRGLGHFMAAGFRAKRPLVWTLPRARLATLHTLTCIPPVWREKAGTKLSVQLRPTFHLARPWSGYGLYFGKVPRNSSSAAMKPSVF